MGSVGVDLSELVDATLRTFDGNVYFVISTRFPAFEGRITDLWIS